MRAQLRHTDIVAIYHALMRFVRNEEVTHLVCDHEREASAAHFDHVLNVEHHSNGSVELGGGHCACAGDRYRVADFASISATDPTNHGVNSEAVEAALQHETEK